MKIVVIERGRPGRRGEIDSTNQDDDRLSVIDGLQRDKQQLLDDLRSMTERLAGGGYALSAWGMHACMHACMHIVLRVCAKSFPASWGMQLESSFCTNHM